MAVGLRRCGNITRVAVSLFCRPSQKPLRAVKKYSQKLKKKLHYPSQLLKIYPENLEPPCTRVCTHFDIPAFRSRSSCRARRGRSRQRTSCTRARSRRSRSRDRRCSGSCCRTMTCSSTRPARAVAPRRPGGI